MSSLSPAHYDRVQKELLHVSLRQVTEDPEPGQLANLARRSASFKKNRQDLDNHRLRKAAERVAADKREDDALRVKLNSVAGKFNCTSMSSPLLICPVGTRSWPTLEVAQDVTSGRRPGADKCTTRSACQTPRYGRFSLTRRTVPPRARPSWTVQQAAPGKSVYRAMIAKLIV